jgi:hypothetical protein
MHLHKMRVVGFVWYMGNMHWTVAVIFLECQIGLPSFNYALGPMKIISVFTCIGCPVGGSMQKVNQII